MESLAKAIASLGPNGARCADAIAAIAEACVSIDRSLRTAPIRGVLGTTGETNVQGEAQQKLDRIADERIVQALAQVSSVAAIGSEERKTLETLHPDGELIVLCDPLDGSSNLDVAGSVGTIFLIQSRRGQGEVREEEALQPGVQALAAGYLLYGTALILTLSVGAAVHAFTYDPEQNRFVHTHKAIRIPDRGGYYSVNEANAPKWLDQMAERLARMKQQTGLGLRYVGAMVADVHRTLLKGGIFLYPPDTKNPNGKLRLMYEAIPMAMLVEAAGGAAYTRTGRILEVQPEALHQRVPVYLGSKSAVEALLD